MKPFLIFVLLLTSFSAFSQTEDNFPTMRFNGVIASKAEYATATEQMRFSVRHARINFRGDIAPLIGYHAQMELSSYGSFQVFDLSATIRPTNNLTILFGQFYIPFLDPYITNPSQSLFANHAFIQHLVRNRDIGMLVTYTFDAGIIPIELNAGLFNANRHNEPVWNSPDSLSLMLRANFGRLTGFRTSIKMYNHPSAARGFHHRFYGVTARYEASRLRIDTEALWRNDQNYSERSLFTTYIQAAYRHPIENNRLFQYFVPAVRWDTLSQNNPEHSGIDMHRFTAGIGFSLTTMPWARSSMIRFDYEHFVVNHRITDIFRTPYADSNRFTMGMILTF